jgi:DNA-binding IclR family transcriptional regulator
VELQPSQPANAAAPQSSPASQTLGRGLDVLEQVASGPVALAVIAHRLGLSRSTVHRLATSLLERRYLTLAPRRGYCLGPKLLELGSVARGQIGLVRTARPIMEALADLTGDAVLLATRDGPAAMLIDSVPGARRLAPRLRVGERLDLLRSAAGRALLLDEGEASWRQAISRIDAADPASFVAEMARSARTGLVLDDAEAEPDIVTLAAPVRGADGAIRAALGLATASAYRQAGLGASAREAVRDAAAALSQELGWRVTNRHDVLPSGEAERELQGHERSGKAAPLEAGPAGRQGPRGVPGNAAPVLVETLHEATMIDGAGMKGRDA